MKMLTLFIVLTILNTIIQTVKSIATVKCGKTSAALVNAVAYGLYTYVVFFTAYEGIDLHAKALITAFANLVGVYIVKYVEEKMRKDKLWLVKMTIPHHKATLAKKALDAAEIPYTFYDVNKYFVFDTYCETQKQTATVETICKNFDGKAFATENKLAL